MDMVRVRIQEISVFGKFPKSDIIEIVCVCVRVHARMCLYVVIQQLAKLICLLVRGK